MNQNIDDIINQNIDIN